MDDLFAINAAKTEFRECFNLGDVSRVLAIADPDLVSFSDGQPSEFGASGLEALKGRLTDLFERFAANLSVIVIEIRLQGDIAYDYGWHDLTLTPKRGAKRFVAEIAMWISGGETMRGTGNCGCTWITRTSPIRFGRNRFHRPGRKFTEVSEAFYIAAC